MLKEISIYTNITLLYYYIYYIYLIYWPQICGASYCEFNGDLISNVTEDT